MITKRIIPRLNVRDGKVLNEGALESLEIGTLVSLAQAYSDGGADELFFYDTIATAEEKILFTEILCKVAKSVFIPLTVGGSIHSTSDFERVLSCGADKVSVNTGALIHPALVGEAARKYGDQCVVLSVDVRRMNGEFHVFSKAGKVDTGLNAIEWIKRCVGEGAGEVVVHSIDADTEKKGFDRELLEKICDTVNVPIIASGGLNTKQQFIDLFKRIPEIDAGIADTPFHAGDINVKDLKAVLHNHGINVRL